MVLFMANEGNGPSRTLMSDDTRALHFRMQELERMRRRMEGEVVAFEEIERFYRGLMDSGAFLYAFIDMEGEFLSLNRGMRSVLGQGAKGAEGSILSICPFGQMETMRDLLHDAQREPVSAIVPLMRRDGAQLWLDAEFSAAKFEGRPAIQIVGADVTEWMRLRETPADPWERGVWSRILDGCPGLLCCVVDKKGKLLYASQGYRALALRVLGHSCETGEPYPPLMTEMDKALNGLLLSAALGRTSSVEIAEPHEEGERLWNFAVAPLSLSGGLAGAVVRVLASEPEPPLEPETPEEPARDAEEAEADQEEPPAVEREEEPPLAPSERMGILDAIANPAAVINEHGVCLAANAPFILSLNAAGEVVGARLLSLIPSDNPINAEFHKKFPEVLLAREGILECRLSAEDGDLMWLEVRARPLEWAGFRAVLLTCEDVTRLRRTREQLQRVAVTDRATGVMNRQGMERIMAHEMERALRDHTPLSLMIMDIDGFRRMNETRGYAATELLLKTLTASRKNMLSSDDVLGRWGGDEFMVLTPQSGEAARLLANSLREMAHGGNFDSGGAVTFSVGVAQFKVEMDLSSLVGTAYDAMVAAKRGGGNRTVLAGDLERMG